MESFSRLLLSCACSLFCFYEVICAQGAAALPKYDYYELKYTGSYPIRDIIQLFTNHNDSILILTVPGVAGEIKMHRSPGVKEIFEGNDIKGVLVQQPGLNVKCRFYTDSLSGKGALNLFNDDFSFKGELVKSADHINLAGSRPFLTKSEMQEDVLQLKRMVEYIHPATFYFTSQKQFESNFNTRLDKLKTLAKDDSLNINEFYSYVAPLVAQIGCGHARVSIPADIPSNANEATMFPLPLYITGDKAYVSISNSSVIPPGTEVISVNGVKVNEIISALKNCIPADALLETTKYYRLNGRFFHTLFKWCYGGFENFTIETKISNSKKISKYHLSGISTEKLDLYYPQPNDLNPVKRHLSLNHLPDYNASVLRIATFGFYNDNKGFQHFIDSTFLNLKTMHVDNLIIDLRRNGGGDPFCSSYLLRYLANKPVEYFSKDVGSFYGNLTKPLESFENAFKGNLWILTDAGCMSSTTHFLALLKYHKIGKFAGSETAGNFRCNDNSKIFTLLNSGIQFAIARKTFSVAVEGQAKDRGIIPDFKIEQSLNDVINKTDATLNYVLDNIKFNR
ncbi:MAG: S41 family peptidase [Bacteroidales bacterium]